jgi:hypothetical protein
MKGIKFFAVLFFAIFTACESAASNTNSSSAMMNSNMMSSASLMATKIEGGGGGGGGREEPAPQDISLEQSDQTQNAPTIIERKIIRNADLTLEADAPEEAQNKITAIAESKGGFVIESSQSSSDARATTRDTVTMTIRVPAAKFNETLDEIRKTSSRVIVETVKGQDVTEEFIDIEARLKTKKALEEQFLGIMKQSKSVEDALNVQRELADVRGEIEQIEGRKRFLENQSSLSTVKIKLQSPTQFSPNSSGFFYQLGQAVSTGFNGASSFILALVTALITLLPFLLFIVLPIYLVIRYLLKKNRKQKLAQEIAREEIKNE